MKDNRRRHSERIPTWDLIHKYPGDWRAIFVGDATMSPYEVTMPGRLGPSTGTRKPAPSG
ncbi:Uncharacterized protein conserved in bacteria [Brevundimonas vancanneytii]|uniref:Uncharacterized protein conserved in bacteria n=1 Tax=Brevundimonas vancanneytii TaxID=1325724 RepID=A0A4P1KA48_9CAUL|nr:hypothetical protein [Brevundimonas vancanneytii]VTO17307.1 Uncharacterized protein conserved in bacteria [Brevundimonas vancanneytii]